MLPAKFPQYVRMRVAHRKNLKVFYRFICAVRGSTVGRLPAAISFSRVYSRESIYYRTYNQYTRMLHRECQTWILDSLIYRSRT